MSGSTISTTIHNSVSVGSASYPSPLTITDTGAVLAQAGSFFGDSAILLSSGTVLNHGVLVAGGSSQLLNGASGVSMDGGYLFSDGAITGGYGYGNAGAGISIDEGSISNAGQITGGGASLNGGAGISAAGVSLKTSGYVTGGTAGVTGGAGISMFGGYAENSGTIVGGRGGTAGGAGARIINSTSVNAYGVTTTTPATLVNKGEIEGGAGGVGDGIGVTLLNSALVNYGIVEDGVSVYGGTVTNAGIIDGDTVFQQNSVASRLIVDPGATFSGDVSGSDTNLELAEGDHDANGVLYMAGSFSGFDTIAFDEGASWLLVGGSAELAGGEVISGFDPEDTLALEGFQATSSTFVAGTGLILSDGTTTETLDLVGNFSPSELIVRPYTFETFIELCYLRGTRIATPVGEVAVEALDIGDAVITRFGGYRRIKWIGRQSYDRRFIRSNRERIPVRIAAGALGPNLPKRDLFVSPGHAMLLGDVLVLARDLVNGITVTQSVCPEEVHYYQLEFETHDCVLAEGAWSESFCDYNGLRNQFHNVAEFWRLYPDHVTPAEHRMCTPRPEFGPALAAALAPVAARAAALVRPGLLRGFVDHLDAEGRIGGWVQDAGNPALPLHLEIRLGDRPVGTALACQYRQDLAAAGFGNGRCGFSAEIGVLPRAALPDLSVWCGATELPLAPHCLEAVTRRRKRA